MDLIIIRRSARKQLSVYKLKEEVPAGVGLTNDPILSAWYLHNFLLSKGRKRFGKEQL